MAAPRLLSLRWRLVAVFGMALVLILAAGRYIQYRVAVELLARDLDAQLQARLGALRAERRLAVAVGAADTQSPADAFSSAPRLTSDRRPSLLLRLVMPVEAHDSLAATALPWFTSAWGDDGRLLAAADLPPGIRWAPEWRGREGRIWTDAAGRHRLAACADGDTLLVVGAQLATLHEAAREVARFHAATLVVCAPLLVGLLVFLLDRLLRPLAAITSTVERIRGGRFQDRIDLATADAEIAGMAATINAMLDRLEEAREKQARFNADLAHEVLGPVHGILLDSDALGEHGADPGPPGAVAAIRSRARRIETLCEALLSYSKSQAIASAELRRVDLEPVVDLAVEQVASAAAARGVRICNAVGPAVVCGQAELLQQVFINLLANAIGHSPAGAVVSIWSDHGPEAVRVRVIDHGDGVDAADTAHVFERFFARPPAGEATLPSHGVGLSLSREIMRSHGGDLTVAPTPGGGATFEATFPDRSGDVVVS